MGSRARALYRLLQRMPLPNALGHKPCDRNLKPTHEEQETQRREGERGRERERERERQSHKPSQTSGSPRNLNFDPPSPLEATPQMLNPHNRHTQLLKATILVEAPCLHPLRVRYHLAMPRLELRLVRGLHGVLLRSR